MTIYRAGWTDEARFRVAVCGRRFGKTFNAAEEMRRAASMAVKMKVSPDNEIWYGAPTLKQAKRVFWPRLKRAIPEKWWDGKPNESELYIRIKPHGHVLRIVGLENFDDLRGSGLWFFLGDEWADCRPEAWLEVIRPMLSTARGHALFIGTPKGFDHFREFYLYGQPGGEPGWKSFHFTSIDGGNIPPEEIAEARRQLDPRTFRQEYEASFETFTGRVIYAFDRVNSVRPCAHDPALPVHVGMDFNVNPMSATIWQEHGEETWQVGEIVLPSSNTDEMVAEIKRRYGRHEAQFSGEMKAIVSHITIYPDPAGAARRTSAQGRTDIGILRDAGFNVLAMSSHPLVRDRHNNMNARFCNAEGVRRAFVSPDCVESIKCYERLSYKEDSSDVDKDSGYDHVVDASGYYLFGRYAYRPAQSLRVEHTNR